MACRLRTIVVSIIIYCCIKQKYKVTKNILGKWDGLCLRTNDLNQNPILQQFY
jgi:hypothetical protein